MVFNISLSFPVPHFRICKTGVLYLPCRGVAEISTLKSVMLLCYRTVKSLKPILSLFPGFLFLTFCFAKQGNHEALQNHSNLLFLLYLLVPKPVKFYQNLCSDFIYFVLDFNDLRTHMDHCIYCCVLNILTFQRLISRLLRVCQSLSLDTICLFDIDRFHKCDINRKKSIST